jgi:hypothetical protein
MALLHLLVQPWLQELTRKWVTDRTWSSTTVAAEIWSLPATRYIVPLRTQGNNWWKYWTTYYEAASMSRVQIPPKGRRFDPLLSMTAMTQSSIIPSRDQPDYQISSSWRTRIIDSPKSANGSHPLEIAWKGGCCRSQFCRKHRNPPDNRL